MNRPAPRRRTRSETAPLATFGDFIAERRRTLRLTQLDLADLADVGVSSVRRLEAGQTSPTLEMTLRILDTLGLTLATMPHAAARELPDNVAELRVTKADQQ
ncbi:helix-turn-helix domain-containing protein [Nocardia sp. NPDC051052]|uniref:helix-turn-helix domain-containing protein n=1 Tax=Nocardia sp. NPDC051052 TaxID=3364322 RepID=UPI0037A66F97